MDIQVVYVVYAVCAVVDSLEFKTRTLIHGAMLLYIV